MPNIPFIPLPAPRSQAEADVVRQLISHQEMQSTGDITVEPMPGPVYSNPQLPPSQGYPSKPVTDPYSDPGYNYRPGTAQPIIKT